MMAPDEIVAKSKQLAALVTPHISMLMLVKRRKGSTPDDVLYNGTASFVDTGKAQLIVTCAHVIASFNSLRKEYPDATLAIGGEAARPISITDAEVIDQGERQLDLATLKLRDPERIGHVGKKYFLNAEWPPRRPSIKALAMAIGYPGDFRRKATSGLQMGMISIVDFITSVSDRHVCLVDENHEREKAQIVPGTKEPESLMGMSGGALFVFDEEAHLVRLAGFTYEATSGVHAMVFAAHASFINADGTFDRNALMVFNNEK